MNKDFLKATILYTLGVVLGFWLIWAALDLALPEANLNLLRALSTAFGINLPDDVFVGTAMGPRAVVVIGIIAMLSIGLIVLNVFFGAVVTSHIIRPRVKLITSLRGVLSTKWNPTLPYALIRMSNFHHSELVDVRLSIVLTVQERRDNGIKGEQFMSYLPLTGYTPQHILVMTQKMPWSIAVPADAMLGNSMTKDYHFKPGEPITKSFSAGKTLTYAKRSIEVLVQGIDSKSYSSFVIHRKIDVDEQDGGKYTLHLHRGAFKSLPLQIEKPEELEQYVD